MSPLTLVVAATKQNGIGLNGKMPWHIPRDLAYFKHITTHSPDAEVNAVFMGRKTWESIAHKFRPLKDRINVVLSRNSDYDLFPGGPPPDADPTYLYPDLKTAVDAVRSQPNVDRLFVIGGSSVYQDALGCQDPSLKPRRILMTRIYNPEFECDAFFPDVLDGVEWRRASHEEHSAWAGFDVPAGIQTEHDIKFEFQMWVR